MTAPTDQQPADSPSTDAAASSQPAAPPDTVTALNAALSCEHAAVWSYAVIAAYDPDDAALIATITAGHLARRDSITALIKQSGGTPVPAAAAYNLPVAIGDLPSARATAALIETDCMTAWHAVVGTTDDSVIRGVALAGLADAAVWLTGLKIAAADPAPTIAFPGQA